MPQKIIVQTCRKLAYFVFFIFIGCQPHKEGIPVDPVLAAIIDELPERDVEAIIKANPNSLHYYDMMAKQMEEPLLTALAEAAYFEKDADLAKLLIRYGADCDVAIKFYQDEYGPDHPAIKRIIRLGNEVKGRSIP